MGFGCLTALNSFGNPSLIVLYGGVKTAFCKKKFCFASLSWASWDTHLKQNRNHISSFPCSQKDRFHPPAALVPAGSGRRNLMITPLLGSVVCYTAYIFFWTLKNVFCLPIGSIPKTLMRLQILSSLWFQSMSGGFSVSFPWNFCNGCVRNAWSNEENSNWYVCFSAYTCTV